MKHSGLQVSALALVCAIALGSGLVSGSVLSANLLAQSLFDSATVQDLQREQDDARRFEENKKNEVRHLTDRTRECKDKTKQVKDAQKNGSKKAAELAARVASFCGSVEKAKKALQSAKTNEELDDLRSDVITPEIQDIANDLNDELMALNSQNDVLRGLKENKSTCKNFARSMKDVSRQAKQSKLDVSALLTQGNDKVKECENNYKQLGTYAAADQWEEARDLLQEYFWNNELHESFNEIREAIQACSDIGRMIGDASRGTKQIEKALKQFKAKKLDTAAAEASFAEALAVIAEARTTASSGTCDRDANEDIKSRLEEAGNNLESELEDLKSQSSGGSKGYGKKSFDEEEF